MGRPYTTLLRWFFQKRSCYARAPRGHASIETQAAPIGRQVGCSVPETPVALLDSSTLLLDGCLPFDGHGTAPHQAFFCSSASAAASTKNLSVFLSIASLRCLCEAVRAAPCSVNQANTTANQRRPHGDERRPALRLCEARYSRGARAWCGAGTRAQRRRGRISGALSGLSGRCLSLLRERVDRPVMTRGGEMWVAGHERAAGTGGKRGAES